MNTDPLAFLTEDLFKKKTKTEAVSYTGEKVIIKKNTVLYLDGDNCLADFSFNLCGNQIVILLTDRIATDKIKELDYRKKIQWGLEALGYKVLFK